MAAFIGIEGGDAHEAMDTALGFEVAEGVGADDVEGGGFVAGFIAFEGVDEGVGEAMSIAPAGVHAEKHGSPVAGFGAAGASVDGEIGVAVIELAGEGTFELEAFVRGEEGVAFFFDIGSERLIAFGGGEVNESEGIDDEAMQGGRGVNELAEGADFLEDVAGAIGVVPEVGSGGSLLEFGEARRFLGDLQASDQVIEALLDVLNFFAFLLVHGKRAN